jgi:hypothetical protein
VVELEGLGGLAGVADLLQAEAAVAIAGVKVELGAMVEAMTGLEEAKAVEFPKPHRH